MSEISFIKKRVIELADALGMGHKQLIESIGMSYSNFTGKACRTPLNSSAISKILALHPTVNAHWLLTGDGEIFKTDTIAYPLPKQNTRKANDVRGVYEVVDPSGMRHDSSHLFVEQRNILDKTIYSQQRTIEKLVDKLDKQDKR